MARVDCWELWDGAYGAAWDAAYGADWPGAYDDGNEYGKEGLSWEVDIPPWAELAFLKRSLRKLAAFIVGLGELPDVILSGLTDDITSPNPGMIFEDASGFW